MQNVDQALQPLECKRYSQRNSQNWGDSGKNWQNSNFRPYSTWIIE